jgi:hypothetical protein
LTKFIPTPVGEQGYKRDMLLTIVEKVAMANNRKRSIPIEKSRQKEQWHVLQSQIDLLGNISEACRRAGVSRHAYYEWRKKSAMEAESAVQGTSKPRNRHPFSLSTAMEGEILKLARENPEWGCDRLSYYLKINGRGVSSPTVQKILIRNKMGRRSQRMPLQPDAP